MVEFFEEMKPSHETWIKKQKLFFVASAPLTGKGTVNCSPKGYDSLRIINSKQVCYLELSGSGIETQAHLQENGRLTIMFCAFEGMPQIMRLMGRGRIVRVDTPEFDTLMTQYFQGSQLEHAVGKRAIIVSDIYKVSTSCGYAVPYYDYKGERETLINVYAKRDQKTVTERWLLNNKFSLDGLPGMRHPSMGKDLAGSSGSNSFPADPSLFALGSPLANVAVLSAGISIGAAVATFVLQRRR
ncbi:hypothetical protein BGZ52_003022 [Haplosporangium bisporale]|nr:hypothetical protein BGZ52_003022 [Haplosporangium bisporale]KAF9201939.1 hypothetical protein BGZ59_002431 [Podila verticillata]KAI9240741.1 MAG: hypothetical protein BYD32DRAFT_407603 [Podila humilis]KFH71727.1 hypothetical protein MVEG_02022 [Podila verticillata NRRL 6337]